MTEKEYFFRDIEIAKDTKPLYIYTPDDYGKLISGGITWSNLDIIVPYSEAERTSVVEQIKSMMVHKKGALPLANVEKDG